MNTDNNRIRPAARVDEIKEYYFARRQREVARLNAEGRDIVSLGIGGPDRPPHPDVIETLCEYARRPDTHAYQISTGIPRLRENFARWYRRYYGVELNPATEILPLIGSKEGVMHVSLTFLNPGDGVLVPNPGYPTYTSASRIAGAEIYPYDLREENGWEPDFDALEKLPLEKIKVMWVNYPHMPTGTPANRRLFEKIIDFGRRHNILIVHDNPYSFILNNGEHLSILQVDGAKDVAIEFNSLSKSHNMSGWRVGMVAGSEEFIGWIRKIKSNVDSGQFRPVMEAAACGLLLDDDWYEDVNREYRERRKIAEEIMTELGCSFDPNQVGLFLWGRIPDSEKNGEAVADRLLYEYGIFIAPGFIFGSNGDRYIRISICATKKNLQKALARIKAGPRH
jgi:hypothetical protein